MIVTSFMKKIIFLPGFLSQTVMTHNTGNGWKQIVLLYHFHPLKNIQTFIAVLFFWKINFVLLVDSA